MRWRWRQSRIRRWRRWIVWTIGVPVVAFVLLSCSGVLALRWVEPPTTAFILAYQVSQWGAERPRAVARQWVPLAQTAPALRRAVIAAEDQKFMLHRGFDLESIVDALETHETGGRLRGASTISQQTAKNLFLWQGRSFLRKGLEAWFTLLIEAVWTKRRILEVYLNVAEFGHGVYGAEAAARRYFGKPARRLSWRESALLASVLPSPRRMNPADPSDYMEERVAWIMDQMRYLPPGSGYPR